MGEAGRGIVGKRYGILVHEREDGDEDRLEALT